MAKGSKTAKKPAVDLDGLKHKSTRRETLAKIGEARAVEAAEPLLRLCCRVKEDEREAISDTLALMGAQVVPTLAKKGLGCKRACVRRCAARALAGIGADAQEAVKALLKALRDEARSVRKEAIHALGKIGDPRAVVSLLALLGESDRGVREVVVDALGNLGDAAAEELCRIFEGRSLDGKPPAAKKREIPLRTRLAAASALGLVGGEVPEACLRLGLEDRSFPSPLRVAALAAQAAMGGEQVVPLAASVLEDGDVALRRQAVRSLRRVDSPESTSHLLALYQDPDKRIRVCALKGLQGRLEQLIERVREGESGVLPAFFAAWSAMDEDDQQRAAVTGALASIGEPLVSSLVALLGQQEEKDGSLPVASVVRFLGAMGADAAQAYDVLVGLLDHPDVETCCEAARALGAIGDQRAVSALTQRLSFDADLLKAKKHKAKQARKRALALQEAAAMGLGLLGKDALLEALQAGRAEDPVTRRGGMLALGAIGGGRALALLDRGISDPDPMVREAAAEMAERAAAKDVRRLGRLLQSDDEKVKDKAVRALGKLDDLRSLDLLLRAYGDPSPRVNRLVVEALAEREGERANSILIAAAAGGSVIALEALARHPIQQAIPALLEALDSPWSKVYGAALEAIRTYAEAFDQDPEVLGEVREAIPELIYLLQDDSAKVRRLALETLGTFRDVGTVDDIAFSLMDEKKSVRLSAVHALAAIGNDEAATLLRASLRETKDEELREEISDALEEMEEED